MRKTVLGLIFAFVGMLMVCCKEEGVRTKTIDELVDEAGALFEDSTLTSLSHGQLVDMSNMVDTFLYWRDYECSNESFQYYRLVSGYLSQLLLRCKVEPSDFTLVDELIYKMQDLNFRFELVFEDDSTMILEHVGNFVPQGNNPYGEEVAVAFEFSKITGLVTRAFCTLPDIFPADKAPNVAFGFGGGDEKAENVNDVLTFNQMQYEAEVGWTFATDSVDTDWLRRYAHFFVFCRGEGETEFNYLVNMNILKEQLAGM